MSITPNPTIYGQSTTITATCSPSTDTCAVDYPSLGTHLCSGTTTCSYTYLSGNLAAGTYSSYYANDITAGTASAGNTLTVNKDTPSESLNNVSQSWTGTSGYSSTITGSFTAANTALAENQITATLSCTNLGSGSTTSTTNSVSLGISNTIGGFPCTFSSAATGNYNAANAVPVNNIIATPLYFQTYNALFTLTPANQIPQAFAPINSIYYPAKLYVTSPNSLISYTLNGVLPTATTLQSGASISYVPPANLANQGIYTANLIETENGNSVTIGANVDVLNMTDITDTPIYTSEIQLFPILANTITFSASPTSYSINSIPSSFTITGNTLSGAVFQTSTSGSFYPQFKLTYGQFSPALSFYANQLNNPKDTAISITPFTFTLANTINAALRTIANFSIFSQQTFNGVAANLTLQVNGTFNNYALTSNNVVSASSWNAFTLQMLKSNYLNPNITLDINNDSATATTGVYFAHYDNFCPITVSSTQAASFPIGLVNSNGSRYDIYAYTQGGGSATGYRLQVLEQKGVGSTAVQEVLIPASLPLVLALQASGQNYAFVVYSSNCKSSYYKGAFTQPSNPIYIVLNVSPSAYVYNTTQATGSCKIVSSNTIAYNVSCFASDPKSLAYAYNLKIFNETSAAGTFTIAHQANFTGSAFATNFTLPRNATYSYQIWASVYSISSSLVLVGHGTLSVQQITIASPLLGFVALIVLLVFVYGGAQTGKPLIVLALADIGFIFVSLIISIPVYVGALFIVFSVIVGWLARG